MSPPRLPRGFYDRDTVVVARDLLGKHLVRVARGKTRVGRIVEVEAYLGAHDLAAHSAKGLTARTRVMFGPPGHAYVYLIYGLHCCMNVVTERAGNGCAVLLRALEPVYGINARCDGPGRLCRVMGIDLGLNGRDLLDDALHIVSAPDSAAFTIDARPRVGVDYAGRWARRLLRFSIRHNPFVSKPG